MNRIHLHRRQVLGALGAVCVPFGLAEPAYAASRPASAVPAGVARLSALETRAGGRLGAFVLDSRSGRGFGWRGDERFALCSTFKLSLAALVLREIEAGRLDGAETLYYSIIDVLPASPRTGDAAGKGCLPVLALAQAALETSDNLAANLLLDRLGGPEALTAFWRQVGDTDSRLDRHEISLNRVYAGDVRDTTTPMAMARTVSALTTGTVLTSASRAQLWGWMKACGTGLARLRAGLPAQWQGGDKTGTFADPRFPAHVNDIALVLAPPADHARFSAPIAVTAYYEPAGQLDAIAPASETVLAEVARIAADPTSW
ncbi:class A beta-lactamase [Novosphingobium nitrogenifigens]|nr:class A beta-lactamase [Novosphingobium nitrogenifigens]